MTWGLRTDQDDARREDLMDVIGDVSPDETPLMTLFGTSTADQTYHQWLTYAVTRPVANSASAEGAEASFGDLTQPSRIGNITQIITKPIQVSRTERKVSVAGMSDPYLFQKAEGLRALKLQMEYTILNSTKASGSSGVARSLDGVDAFISSVVTARNSGTSFSEKELNDMANDAWTAVNSDKVFDTVLCTMKIKQAIAGFGGNSTRYIDASERRLIKDILVYTSSAGEHKVLPHRDVRASAGTVTVYGIREDMHKVAYLDKPMFEELSKTGDSDKGQWVTELTVEVLNQNADLKRTGYAIEG
jgi:hypothetical protein